MSNPELSAKEKKQAIGTEIGARFGSLAGGVLGGTLGSVVPGAGTLIGSIAGALGGEWLGGKVAELVGPEGIYDVAHTFLGSLIDIPEESTPEEPNVPEPEVIPETKPQEITSPTTSSAAEITPTPKTEVAPKTETTPLPLTTAATAASIGTAASIPSGGVTTQPTTPTPTSGGSVNISAGNVTVTGATAQPSTTTVKIPELDTAVTTEAKMKKEEKREEKKERKELGLTDSIFGDSFLGSVAKYATPIGLMTSGIDSIYGSAANEGGILNTIGTGTISAVGSLSDAIFGRKETEVENIPSKEGEYLAYITPVTAGGIPSVQGMASNDSSVLSRASETTNPTLLAAQSNKQPEGNVVNNYNNVSQTSQGFPDFSSMKARAGEATLDMLAASQNQFAAV